MRTIFLLMGILFFSGCAVIQQPPRVITIRAGVVENFVTSYIRGSTKTTVTGVRYHILTRGGQTVIFPAANTKILQIGTPVWLRCSPHHCQIFFRETHGVHL